MDKIPTSTLKRLPQYIEVLKRLKKAGLHEVSATKISVFSNIHHTLVRKDISFTKVAATKTGYKVIPLQKAIEELLDWVDISSCLLVGVGHLGSALLGYQEFSQRGLSIVAAFDNDPQKIDTKVHGVSVYSALDITALALQEKIRIGIITVPPESAQLIADIMVHSGIKAIWNFTPHKIIVPPDIIVEYVDMFASLAVLSRRLAEQHHIK
ncbi:MAG: redox-sensing transcriptional repressor Rex [Candidatus Cloacimonadaceae bacterium]|jgi:redox-sensing transcriptional repressor|nr:redox-sensing transcriptional repressor Rex [Candidatus Cloacimonadota bacterium]MDY0127805.1 redox-sensing transcriptional repressor Rex [Candidatus Cloacimonadaceae bacterium]MCB5254347.1 redox-sensing transcriptional repressor Rex [Candidatus Cloacimonadota bacterium]MCK9177934.1 redox-sensing transcriptional repressor Rex [Candidatus Cloacimonadota bacterium]MCK9242515.1 redox-sensing transcriptional repressor Rex [Candidatus Cloacimonadota bacterium]